LISARIEHATAGVHCGGWEHDRLDHRCTGPAKRGDAADWRTISACRERSTSVRYGDRPGIDPDTGRQCRPLTAELLERLREYEKGNRAKLITKSDPAFFDERTGEPVVWYYRGKGSNIELFDLMGFHAETGEELLPITKEIVDDWKRQSGECGRTASRQAPQLVDPQSYQFFDPITGAARAWYWRSSKGDWEFYNSCGFHPRTGEPLIAFSKEVLDRWVQEAEDREKQRIAGAQRREKERLDREAAEQQAARIRAEREEKERLRRTQAATLCDELAGSPTDPNRSGNGVPFERLKSQAGRAISECEKAMKNYPAEPRFKYQMARALEYVDRQKALAMHRDLVRSGYSAAHDNLGWLIITERKNYAEALAIFRAGTQLGDADSMVSLVEMYDKGYATPRNQRESKWELLSRAAELGHQNARKELQGEQENERQRESQEKVQRRAMQLMGVILQNIPRR
jgi:TPR repeat protein